MSPGDKFLEKRRSERAARLEKAKERIKQQELEKKEEQAAAAAAKKKKTTPSVSTSKLGPPVGTESERRERAYLWYTRCGMLSKEKLLARLKTIPYSDVAEEDLDLLPWMTGDRMVNVAKMLRILWEK